MVFKDRVLNTAILISIAWHAVVISSIRPVFLTGDSVKRDTSIAFLGDILESVGNYASDPVTDQQKPGSQIAMKDEISALDLIGADFINIQSKEKESLNSEADRSLLESGAFRRKETARLSFSDFFIRGDARDRTIIYKPDLEKAVMLPSDFNSGFSANIKFRISRQGFVNYVECVISSGSPEIDRLAMRHVRKWQFVPASEDGQEGIARVSFKQ